MEVPFAGAEDGDNGGRDRGPSGARRPGPQEGTTVFNGRKPTATLALLGAMATGGAVAAAPAGAAPRAATSRTTLASVGIRLSTTHGVGVYGYYNVSSAKVASDLFPSSHDGIDVDCWSATSANLYGRPYGGPGPRDRCAGHGRPTAETPAPGPGPSASGGPGLVEGRNPAWKNIDEGRQAWSTAVPVRWERDPRPSVPRILKM